MTYTTLTPNLLSRRALKMLGFSTLVDSRLVLPPLLHADTLRREPPEIVCDPASVRLLLTDLQRRVFDDHAPYCLQLVVREDHEQGYVVVKRRTAGVPKIWRLLPSSIRIPYSDVLYCSNPSLVVRHLERIKLTILKRQKTALLVADTRLFPELPCSLVMSEPALYRSPLFVADELDRLYSDSVLLSRSRPRSWWGRKVTTSGNRTGKVSVAGYR